MVESSKNKVISILTNPNELNKNDLKIIKNISQTYPYFAPVKILRLILAKKFRTIDYNKILKSTLRFLIFYFLYLLSKFPLLHLNYLRCLDQKKNHLFGAQKQF